MVTKFAYVYVVYYLDPDEQSRHERLRNTQPVVCTSLRRAALFVKPNIEQSDLQEINQGTLWKHGHYWIERTVIIDSFEHGLEWESHHHDGSGRHETGRLPLKFGEPE